MTTATQTALPLRIYRCKRCNKPISEDTEYGESCARIVEHERKIKEAVELLRNNGYEVLKLTDSFNGIDADKFIRDIRGSYES